MWDCLQQLWILACFCSMQSEVRGLLCMQSTGQLLHHIVQYVHRLSRWWTYVLCAQHLNMIRSVRSPCIALRDGIFIRQRTLISCLKGIKWWSGEMCCLCAPYIRAQKTQHIIQVSVCPQVLHQQHVKAAVMQPDVTVSESYMCSSLSPNLSFLHSEVVWRLKQLKTWFKIQSISL